MIDWLLFIPACFALNLAFGPNNLLAMTHGARRGIGFAQAPGLARLLVFIPMISLSALGLGVVLSASALAFSIVKTVGAAYLIWLGFRLWRSAHRLHSTPDTEQTLDLRSAARAEALVAISNPKAILIFAAFFPQFVTTGAYWQSYAALGAAFLALEALAILAYATAGRSAARMAARRLPLMQRVSGAMMAIFGVILLASPQPAPR
ncbi:LysE family translocator [uncultured Tateyamaria sp.]|uniref:LysE family translocator n=1 Tax=uncultured Tateyamaria sp. TaxID=455651 RepID=UPI0026154A64|nr:LysE family translocator [uncultured Tateyamaria sp.]